MSLFTQDIAASIEIDAAPERVWPILIDLGSYGAWNPFTYQVDSTLEIGSPVHLYVQMSPTRKVRSLCTVASVEPPHLLAWGNIMGAPFLMHSMRRQTLEALPDGRCRYTTREVFQGLMVPLVMANAGAQVRQGFERVAQALKERTESA